MLALFQKHMLIKMDLSTDDDNDKVTDVVKLKNKIINLDEKIQTQGVEQMKDWMKPYKKAGSLNAIDTHLLRGIYEINTPEDDNDTEQDVKIELPNSSVDISNETS